MNIVISTIPTRFRTNPPRAICPIVTAPVPKTMALGGVPTGSMNAQVAAKAAGAIDWPAGVDPALGQAALGALFGLPALAAALAAVDPPVRVWWAALRAPREDAWIDEDEAEEEDDEGPLDLTEAVPAV